MASLMNLTVIIGEVKDEFPFTALIILFIGLLLFLKHTGRRILVANIAIAGILVGGLSNILSSGGIYSYNIRWTIVPIMIAFLISDRRSAITVLLLNLLSIVYFYKSSTPENWLDTKFDATTYLLDNAFFVLLIALLVYMFYIGQERLSKEIKSKNDILEQRNLTLKLQKEELDSITKKLKDSNQKLERYGHHTAHDIIQPASTISNFAQLVLRDINNDNVTEKTKSFAELVQKSAVSLIDMSRNMLKLAKADFEQKMKKEHIDLNMVLKTTQEKLANQIINSNAIISSEELPVIYGLETQISSVFQNIISNAIVYRKKNVTPTISVLYELYKNQHLIKIVDNGIGIPKDKLQSVFKSFERVNGNDIAGTGLGLPICKQIIEEHEGKIWANSELGIGTSIQILLPISVANERSKLAVN